MPPADREIPYISVVVLSSQADNSGVRAFCEAWIEHAVRYSLYSELIVVAWNSADSRAVNDVVRELPATSVCDIRVIAVPSGVHRRRGHATPLPIGETVARNAGIRRARGEFILSTNVNVRCSPELVEFLASRPLRKGRLYRIDSRGVEAAPAKEIRLHAREGVFALTADGLRANEQADIASQESGIHFGPGWFPVERDADGAPFRWIENDAEVIVPASATGAAFAMEFEPGPGAGKLPLILEAIDRKGVTVATWHVQQRATVQLWALGSFRLRVTGGGFPVVDHPRILNLRFFRCDVVTASPAPPPAPVDLTAVRAWQPMLLRLLLSYAKQHGAAAMLTRGAVVFRSAVRLLAKRGGDIFGPGIEYWGEGWHRLEEAGAEKYRWVSSNAELVVRIAGEARTLSMLVEPGPSLNGRPFHLIVRLAGGKQLARVTVVGLTAVQVPIPVPNGAVVALSLSPDDQGPPIAGDSRVLNFRVLACACERPSAATAPPPTHPSESWTTVTVSELPAAIDWPSELKPQRREIADMGKPAFLHVEACGDFILMDRERWFDLRGFAEIDHTPRYLDALLCYTAHFAGFNEEVLPDPCLLYRFAPESAAPLATAPSTAQLAVTEDELSWMIAQMRRFHAPLISNMDDWGLAGATLEETTTPFTGVPSEAQ